MTNIKEASTAVQGLRMRGPGAPRGKEIVLPVDPLDGLDRRKESLELKAAGS